MTNGASEPLTIIGIDIDIDGIGKPRNDGTSGSGLYRVPIILSRYVTTEERSLLIALWDRPPQYTSMHRPGIASVEGNRFVLTETTIDEVEQYHSRTLSLVVAEVNVHAERLRREQEAAAARARETEAAHREHVVEVAARVKFE
jgi:hypothetical protein